MKLKVLWKDKEIIFDNVTMELEDGSIIDIEHYNKNIDLGQVKDAWGYICDNCAEEHNIDTTKLGEPLDGVVYYGTSCKETHKVYEITFGREEILNFEILYINETNTLEKILNNSIEEYEYRFLFSYNAEGFGNFYVLQDLQEKSIVYMIKSKTDLCDFFITDFNSKMGYWEQDNKEFADKQKEVVKQLETIKKAD